MKKKTAEAIRASAYQLAWACSDWEYFTSLKENGYKEPKHVSYGSAFIDRSIEISETTINREKYVLKRLLRI